LVSIIFQIHDFCGAQGRQFTMRTVGIRVIFNLNMKSGIGEAPNDSRFIKRAFKCLRVPQSLQKEFRQFGIMRTKI
jgi:hypothetical protein